MATDKEEVLQLIKNLPSDATFEDNQYHIYIREKVEKGLEDIRAGRILSHIEVQEKMAKWLKP